MIFRQAAAARALGVDYRPAEDDDLAFLLQVYADSREEELAITGWSAATKAQFIRQQFEVQHRYYRENYATAAWLVILHEGRNAGRLYLEELTDQIRIIDIALLSRSRRRGIGTAILSDLARESDSKSKPLSIHVERNNPARRLYERLGFVGSGGTPVYELMIRASRNQSTAANFG